MIKITRLKLVNHVRFNDVEIDLGSPEIISILGVNGSGKSFLISCFHPYSSDNRYFKTYSFKEGQTGYKEIEFLTDDGDRYICKHEYIPKGKTHSCKSYINKITKDGTVIELNPTGHNEFYKEQVKKHLHFDSNTFEVGMISFESRGLTGSSPSNRKKVLETTVDLDVMKNFKKNATNLSKEYASFSKLTFKDRANILNSCSISQLQDEINEYTKNIDKYQKTQSELTEKKSRLTREYEDTLKLESFDNPEVLIKASKYYSKYPNITRTLLDILHEYHNVNLKADVVATNIENIQEEINYLKGYKLDKESYETKSKELESNRKELENVKTRFNSKYNHLDDVKSIDIIIYQLNNIDSKLGITSADNAETRLKELTDILERLTDLEHKFFACKEICGENKYEPKKLDVCKNCDLNNYYGEASEYIQKHEKEYEQFMKDKEELFSEKDRLTQTILTIKKIDVTPLHIFKTYERITLDELLKKHTETNMSNVIYELYNDYKYEISVIETLEEKNKELEDICNKLHERLEAGSDLNLLGEFEKEITELRAELLSLEMNSKSLKNIIDYVGCNFNSGAVLNMKGKDIVETAQKIQKINSEKSRLESELTKTNSELIYCSNQITSNIELKLVNENKINRYNELDAKYNEFSKTADVLTRCRTLLEKDIPILLMKDNLDFIENTTNEMLAENDIDISIQIIPNETDIRISAITNNVEVDDISQLSSGEKCLVSLLLNATILHLLGYGVLCLDEIDANLSINNTSKFSSIIYNIMNRLDISQIICISHSVNSRISESTRIAIGDISDLDLSDTDNLIHI